MAADSEKPSERPDVTRWMSWKFYALGTILFLVGAVLTAGGGYLCYLGGTPYYLLAGVGLAVSGLLLARRDRRAAVLFALVYAGTIIWAYLEAGLTFWAQVPRLAPFLVMGFIFSLILGQLDSRRRLLGRILAGLQLALIVSGLAAMFFPHGAIHPEPAGTPAVVAPVTDAGSQDWSHYGRDAGGSHYVPFDQIKPDNVANLKVAWTFRTGEINETADFEGTPLQIGNSLFLCTAQNRVFAIDADTGAEKWRFDPKVSAKGPFNHCRGVSYHRAAAPNEPSGPSFATRSCDERIITTTIDARLFALDARTGKPCRDFGASGSVDLTIGLGRMSPGSYYPTSAPLIARDLIVVGGWITDDEAMDQVGGVVRAYDVKTGTLAWSWDPGAKPGQTKNAEVNTYTRSTPNFWGTATFDDKLGLIYIPTGSGQNDHWGVQRSPETDKFSTAVVALKVESGAVAWTYQTIHHDLWDWDIAAPPTFVDMKDEKGNVVPALVQIGKAGEIFVLDRRTGRPVTRVEERPVPRVSTIPNERVSPTQPFSVGMPEVIPTTFSETTMWGTTFFDQLYCRIQFRKLDWQGKYTPPSLKPVAISPGILGGMNWGGVAIDQPRNLMVTNDIRLASTVRLVPIETLKNGTKAPSHSSMGIYMVEGSPYAVEFQDLLSFLGLPCEQPPWGMMTGIDLSARKIAWQIPAGTTEGWLEDLVGLPAPLPMGMPTLSSAIATASGLTFYAGAGDPYVRAWDTRTGSEIWRHKLPVGSMATPMSYVSPATGRQYLVVSAGGSPQSKQIGDYVIAYALKRE